MHFDVIASLLTLTAMEIVLGIDNLLVISILSGKLPAQDQAKARRVGLVIALLTRVGLLFAISLLIRSTTPLFSIAGQSFSLRSLVLLGGGLFLIAKSTQEMYDKLEGSERDKHVAQPASWGMVVLQIVLMDIVFSLDSVITAVGMAQKLSVMVAAMVLACLVMLFSATWVSNFVHRHPSLVLLGLSFLLLIGVLLCAEGFGVHVHRGYIYFAMAFSLLIELLNMRLRMRKRRMPVSLHQIGEGQ